MVSWVPIIAVGDGAMAYKEWGQMILGAGLGEHQYTFSSIFNVFLSGNLDQNMYKSTKLV